MKQYTDRIPRYTSYPTAPHFHDGVTGEVYTQWLQAINVKQSLSLYLHIPYCKQLCWFCGCHTKVVNRYESVTRYLSLLEQEIALVAEHIAPASVRHIHFGGGSPTVLEPADFTRLMKTLRQSFTVADHVEMAVEIDPRTVDAQKIAAYTGAGVNRASIGVQDLDATVQEAINRVQPFSMVAGVVEQLRKHGINALNMDLVYGLPHQTLDTIRETIASILRMVPDRIALFGYAHVPWMKKHQRLIPEQSLPDSALRLAMFHEAVRLLQEAGYVPIGLDHFAKPEDALAKAAKAGTLQRNFQGYTIDSADALIGFGISSISSLMQGYVQNTADNRAYKAMLTEGKLPVARGVAFAGEDTMRREIIMALMSNLSVDLVAVTQGYGRDLSCLAPELAALQPYVDSGNVQLKGGKMVVNPQARGDIRLISSVFDTYLQQKTMCYSKAV